MPQFRLLHASDLHFARVPHQIGIPEVFHGFGGGKWAPVSSQSNSRAEALADFVHANSQGPDVIVISGDLAATGDPADLRAARRYLTAPAVDDCFSAQHQPTLQAAGKPVVLIPGNHDRFRRFHFPGGTNFDRAFGDFWGARQGVQCLWVKQRGEVTLALVGVDFTLRASDLGGGFHAGFLVGFLGQGRVYRHRLRALRQVTHSVRRQYPGCAVVWVMHFEPETRSPLLALLDDYLLANLLTREPVAAILCGHSHRSNASKQWMSTPVFVCGTTTQHRSRSGNSFFVLDFTLQPGYPTTIACREYRYDARQARFV
jgi:3',5'-cyclic AMP phosphodiesterase CpdA